MLDRDIPHDCAVTCITLTRQPAEGFVRNAGAGWVGSVLPNGAERLEWGHLLRYGGQGQAAHHTSENCFYEL